MRHEFVLIGQTCEVKADHFVSPKPWLFSRPQGDQHAGDNRAISLNLNAIFVLAEQMAEAKYLLEKAEEDFDRPPFRKDQTDDVRRHIEQISRNSQNAVAINAAGAAAILSTSCVRVGANANNSHWMIEVGTFGELYDFITDDFIQFGAVVAVVLFHHRVNTVVAHQLTVAGCGQRRNRVVSCLSATIASSSSVYWHRSQGLSDSCFVLRHCASRRLRSRLPACKRSTLRTPQRETRTVRQFQIGIGSKF